MYSIKLCPNVFIRIKQSRYYNLLLFVMQCILKWTLYGLVAILCWQYVLKGSSTPPPKHLKLEETRHDIEAKSSLSDGNVDFDAIMIAKRLRNKNSSCGYFSIDPYWYMRTGNLLFLYSLAFSASMTIKRPLIIRNITILTGSFNISAKIFKNDQEHDSFEQLRELYEPRDEHDPTFTGLKLRLDCNKNYTFRGGFAFGHTFRFFEPHWAAEIRREFSFLPEIRTTCNRVIEQFSTPGSVLVGVHVRRGDYLHPFNQWFGFVTLGKDYRISSNNSLSYKVDYLNTPKP